MLSHIAWDRMLLKPSNIPHLRTKPLPSQNRNTICEPLFPNDRPCNKFQSSNKLLQTPSTPPAINSVWMFYEYPPVATIQQLQSLCVDNWPSAPRNIDGWTAAALAKHWSKALACSAVRNWLSKLNWRRNRWYGHCEVGGHVLLATVWSITAMNWSSSLAR
jgi:hypothetical protein